MNVTQAEFARQVGVAKSMVTQWKQAGRLVMHGNRVDVEASVRRIITTRDPNRDDVVQRWADARGRELFPDLVDAPPAPPADPPPAGPDFQSARAMKEHYLALQAKADYEKTIGRLAPVEDTRRAGAEIGTLLRVRLEALPRQLGPELAPISEPERVQALLAEHVEQLLGELAQAIGAMDGGGETA